VSITARDDGVWCLITVEDSGEGIDETMGERILEPFFTTKSNGTGLGLAIVHRLAEAHRERVSVDNRVEGGVRVSIFLPRFEQATKP
jgi:signal transduction histidine kinase